MTDITKNGKGGFGAFAAHEHESSDARAAEALHPTQDAAPSTTLESKPAATSAASDGVTPVTATVTPSHGA